MNCLHGQCEEVAELRDLRREATALRAAVNDGVLSSATERDAIVAFIAAIALDLDDDRDDHGATRLLQSVADRIAAEEHLDHAESAADSGCPFGEAGCTRCAHLPREQWRAAHDHPEATDPPDGTTPDYLEEL